MENNLIKISAVYSGDTTFVNPENINNEATRYRIIENNISEYSMTYNNFIILT